MLDAPLPFLFLTGLLVGLTLGSFVTMLAYRLPRRLSICLPPSSCPHCHARLGVRDLVPVFSWLFARGRCRHCAAPIGLRYPLIELAVASACTIAFVLIGLNLWLVPALLLIVALATLIVIEVEGPCQ